VLKRRVGKGVILAAGDGDRLGSLTITCPKVLLPINGTPLIRYSIEALVAAGIAEATKAAVDSIGCMKDIGAEDGSCV